MSASNKKTNPTYLDNNKFTFKSIAPSPPGFIDYKELRDSPFLTFNIKHPGVQNFMKRDLSKLVDFDLQKVLVS